MSAIPALRARTRLPLLLLSALLLFLIRAACSADTDALVKALVPKLDELAMTTPEAEWRTTTTKGSLARFFGLSWPLPMSTMTREQLDTKTREIQRDVPEVPDHEGMAAILGEEYPLLRVGDTVEFTATKAGREQHVKGKVTAVRTGNTDDHVEIDETDLWKKDRLPDEIKARLFADERTKWIERNLPSVRKRLEARRSEALAKVPEAAKKLVEASGLIPAPASWTQSLPLTPVFLTDSEVELVLDGLSAYARARREVIYQRRRAWGEQQAREGKAREQQTREERKKGFQQLLTVFHSTCRAIAAQDQFGQESYACATKALRIADEMGGYAQELRDLPDSERGPLGSKVTHLKQMCTLWEASTAKLWGAYQELAQKNPELAWLVDGGTERAPRFGLNYDLKACVKCEGTGSPRVNRSAAMAQAMNEGKSSHTYVCECKGLGKSMVSEGRYDRGLEMDRALLNE